MNDLPNELIEQILLYLNHMEIASCYKASSKFHVLTETRLVKMLEEYVPRWIANRYYYDEKYFVEMRSEQEHLIIFLDHISREKAITFFKGWMLHNKFDDILTYPDHLF